MKKTARIYKALSDPNRLRILMMLREKSLCVCEMVDVLQLANSTVSKHLSILRDAGLILDEKKGRWVNYRLADSGESPDLSVVFASLRTQLDRDDQVLSDRETLKKTDRYTICSTPAPENLLDPPV